MRFRRVRAAGRWLRPSLVAACAGTLIGAIVEGIPMGRPLGILAAAALFSLVVLPILVVATTTIRAIIVGWIGDGFPATLVEEGQSSPRLVGWLVYLAMALGIEAVVVTLATSKLVGTRGELDPMMVSLVAPAVAVVCALALVAMSRPVATGLSALVRMADARWRRGGRRSLITTRRIVVSVASLIALAIAVGWFVMIGPQLGPLDLSVIEAPLIAIVATIAIYVLGERARLRTPFAALAIVGAGVAASAFVMLRAAPGVMLEVWGERPVAGLAVDRLFDPEAIRSSMPLESFAPTMKPNAPHPDIVLITIDTVRADHTPPYGGKAAMPTLARLAETGAVFEWAFSPSNVTRRSIPSIDMGLDPTRVRGRVVGWALKVDPRHVMMAERLSAAGYETAAFMCCEGFWAPEAKTGLSRGMQHVETEHVGSRLAQLAHAWIEAREAQPHDKPLFVRMHLIEPHNWLGGAREPSKDEDRTRMYDSVLAQCDEMIAAVTTAFHRTPDKMPIVIVTADHGEGLGDHGAPYHSTDLYNSQTHVPLVISGPGIAPHRIPETVSLTDLTPTIIELAGYQPPKGHSIDGRSLADLASGARDGNPTGGEAFAAMVKDRSNPGGVMMFVSGTWKLIDKGGKTELYDTRADPEEKIDRSADQPQIAAKLVELLQAHITAAKQSPFNFED